MNKNKNESGRSMVEMLGVLAIIGVLSIGGIAGYSTAMRKYQANQIIDAANKYAFIVYNACQQAIINGTVDDVDSCSYSDEDASFDPPLFANSNIEQIESVKDIDYNVVTSTDEGDYVSVVIFFNDNNICKATKSLINDDTDFHCMEIFASTPFLEIFVKQS